MRANKEFNVLFTKKAEPEKLYFHCAQCPGERMIRIATGLRCPNCGGVNVATYTVDTYKEKEKVTS